jgi:hypothetical protein
MNFSFVTALMPAREKKKSRAEDHNGSDEFRGRPMTGLYAQLTPAQRKRVLAHEGPVGSGSVEMPSPRKTTKA